MLTHQKSERGQALILLVLGIMGLIGMTALAVDGGNAFLDRRQAQNAADTAALAAALAKVRGQNWNSAALSRASNNGYDNNGTSNTVQLYNPPINGPYAGNGEYVQVVITSHVKTFFGAVIGQNQITNRVDAIARAKPSVAEQMLSGNAMVSLMPESDCLNHKAFYAHGEGSATVTGGNVFINSSNPTCALIQRGNGSVDVIGGDIVTIVGGASVQKPELITPFPPVTGAIPIPYPPPIIFPKPSCSQPAIQSENEMSPGNFEGDFPPSGVDKLQPGLYCIHHGDFIVNGNTKLSGDHVMIFVKSGAVHFNGGATINLKAPTSGPFKGLLLYLPIENTNKVVLNGNADSAFRGTILAPGAEIHLNGNGSSYGYHSQIIGYQIDMSGNENMHITYVDDQNYDAMLPPQVELTK
jgi:Flp pilus assembly protein TadG